MSDIKERIIGAVTIMSEKQASIIWGIIENNFANPSWNDIPEEIPDAIDLQLLDEIKNDPDCHEFIPAEDALKQLGL